MNPPLVTGPQPQYNNPPINAQYFTPSNFFISNITLGNQTLVTTTVNHNYVIGQNVRLVIPPSFGCIQLNNSQSYVQSIPMPNQVLLGLDSSQNVDPYIASSSTTQAQINAIGSINLGAINAYGNLNTSTTVPGSYENISPL